MRRARCGSRGWSRVPEEEAARLREAAEREAAAEAAAREGEAARKREEERLER
jgi:hypothetical protein